MSPQPVFARRLRAERESQGLSLRQLGGRAGVNATTVLRAEHCSDPSLGIAVALAGALGLPLAALLAEPECARCGGTPPAGFICGSCGRAAGKPAAAGEGVPGRG